MNTTNTHTPQAFSEYPLEGALQSSLADLGYTHLTKAQEACLSVVLEGQDAAVKAKTGSGKTLAFGLGALQSLIKAQEAGHSGVHTLVLCPTRELAQQVAEQLRLLAKHHANTKILTLVGGISIGPQIASLVHAPSVVVGTPGRVMDLISKQKLDVSAVKTLVLDEADRILDMGFADQMGWILNALPKARHSMLFSATFGSAIQSLTKQYLQKAAVIEVEDNEQHSQITQLGYQIQDDRSVYAVAALLTHYQPQSCMVFCQTKHETQALCDELLGMGFSVHTIHGDLTQAQRQQVLTQFSIKTCNVLVATDVAARGLDLDQVDLVINAQLADSAETHTHRVGRTGRAEQTGTAITLIQDNQQKALAQIAELTNSHIPVKHIQALRFHANRIALPEHECVMIDGGKKQKISKGDLLGALIKQAEIVKDDIGKMQITHDKSYVAIKQRSVKRALAHFREHKVKGKSLRARKLK
ncbi:ATP-dependent RNA helicase DbpA [Glaciecola sp. 2405UD65-10]|uniref:ATP-dependent RNA helicase DbpA n=1 Tax=Glaciecola sp. 2405UD65-10 TaxID=3397244 RepID=UPI003B5C1FD6